jgi:hypothetical protein
LRAGSAEVQDKAIELVAELGKEYSQSFLEFLRPTVPRLSGSLVPPANNARARSRSPPRARAANEFAVAELCGMRVAKDFSGEIYFGTVVEKIKGAVLAAPNAKGIRLWEAVWKIEYDDGDVEQQNRFEIIALIKNYRRHRQADNRIGLNNAVNIEEVNEDVDEEADSAPEHGILGTGTNFLDPRYNLLELLTPTATQNRLSYLVELVLDKAQKQISNEAVKVRLRKDASAFGAKGMPGDVRAISRYLGARTVAEVTRHLCGNSECSYAWIGAVSPSEFDSTDVCPDCGTPRYSREGAQLKPQRKFYYFGAAQAIEALHRHPVFRKNWKKNVDISLNAYRSSPDAKRLDRATFGEALAPENGLYISMADGFQSHKSKTQSITGKEKILILNTA